MRAAFSATDGQAQAAGSTAAVVPHLARPWLSPVRQEQDGDLRAVPHRRQSGRKEVKNPFYSLLDDEAVVDGIFRDFGMDPATSRIICGHVPVKVNGGTP